MRTAGRAVGDEGDNLRRLSVWTAPLAVLAGVWLWMAFSSGGYLPRQWLPYGLLIGLFGLVTTVFIAYPRRPRQLGLAVLALFGLYGLWVLASALWAESSTRVWLEGGRTFAYVLLFALALVYFTDTRVRKAFRYLLVSGYAAILIVCIVKLWTTGNLPAIFFEGRLVFPVSYPNNNAALFLTGFWPLLWMAAAKDEHAPIRGAALGVATGLLGLAILTQSRGAVWSLAISLVIVFVISPIRLRMLFYLIVPSLLLVYEYPKLADYWLKGPAAVGGGIGARVLLIASLAAMLIGMILALLERWVTVSRLMKTIFGSVILLGLAGGLVYGTVVIAEKNGGIGNWVEQTWSEFTGSRTPAEDSSTVKSRFTHMYASGRTNLWRIAWHEFTSSPALGVGADNYVFQYDLERRFEVSKPKQAHSLVLQVLGETGLVGGVFGFGAIVLALGAILWPRMYAGWANARLTWLRRRARPGPATEAESSRRKTWGRDPSVYGWVMALMGALTYWFIHGSVDWLWQMPAVTIPALLMLAAAVSEIDARAGVLWPRLGRTVRTLTPIVPAEESNEQDHSAETVTKRSSAAGLFSGRRRADRYAARARRTQRKEKRRQRRDELLRPRGLLSLVFRAAIICLSLALLILAGFPYLSEQIQDSAISLAATNPLRAASRALSVRLLIPSDPGPYVTQASIFHGAAEAAAAVSSGAVLDDLALEIEARQQAINREGADWTLHYQAGVAALNLLIASGEISGLEGVADYQEARVFIPGLSDWSSLRGALTTTGAPAPAGAAPSSLAQSPESQETARQYRSLTRAELLSISLAHLAEAEKRNPLAGQVDNAVSQARALGAGGTGDTPIGTVWWNRTITKSLEPIGFSLRP